MIHYHISYQKPHQQFIDFHLSLTDIQQDKIFLQLPAWRPGRYEIGNFAKNIQKFRVEDAVGQSIPFRKITKDRWEIETQGQTEIHVYYNYYAATLDAGSTWLDEHQLYINFVNCIMYVEGRMDEAYTVAFSLPPQYQIACGLKKVNEHILEAPSFYHLAESPMIASPSLTHWQYEVDGHLFHLWFQGVCRLDEAETTARFAAFTQAQIQTLGEFPCQEYHFLYQFLPYRAYHGVEHFNSTVIALGPAEQILENTKIYEDFLGVSSHELFHTWNIIRIRPAEMMPYDYTRENYFPTGFVAEGITTYYGDLFLARSGVITKEDYFLELNKLFKRHFENFGRFNHSLVESSHDLWLDGYAPGIPHRKVSIYVKGAIISMILDLALRKNTGNKYSLDDFMRILWNQFGKQAKGYTLQDLQKIVDELSGHSLPDFFDHFVWGKVPVEHRLDVLFQTVGCSLKEIPSAFFAENLFGFRTILKENKWVVSALEPGSIADHQLRLEDEIIAINQRRVTDSVEELLADQTTVTLTIFRSHYLRQVTLEHDGRTYFKQYVIEQIEEATAQEKENFSRWLHQEW